MDSADSRGLCARLADDLDWLEGHTRLAGKASPDTAQLRVAAGVVRNVLAPFLDGRPARPLHLAVVGGAGTGKSTVVNFLVGRVAAEANPQAGFTRHPIAYVPAGSNVETEVTSWSSVPGFLGGLRRLLEPTPSSLDEDVYQVREVHPPAPPAGTSATPAATVGGLNGFVVWDCPDMTTWAATGYVPRLLEVASLADVLVYVASDERYNDAMPTQFLRLLVEAGKAVVVVLTKMRESQAAALADHFTKVVLDELPKVDGQRPVVPVLTIPFLKPDQLSDLGGGAARYRVALLNQVTVVTTPPAAARKRTVANATHFLDAKLAALLAVARADLQALEEWRGLVQEGQNEARRRYRAEHLTGEGFRRFDEAADQLVEMLELPSVSRAATIALWVVRAPYRLLRDQLGKMFRRPDPVSLPERRVLEDALSSWLDGLRAEAIQRQGRHAIWAHVAAGFAGPLPDLARDHFAQDFRRYELGVADEVEGVRRGVTESLAARPKLLTGLRAAKLLADMLAVAAAPLLVGWTWWLLLAVPVLVSLEHQLVEWLCRAYVEQKREQSRLRQESLVSEYLTGPLAEWLAQWPVTGGSTFERLQRALRRLPEHLDGVREAVRGRLKELPE